MSLCLVTTRRIGGAVIRLRCETHHALPNEAAAFEECGLDFNLQVPMLHLYWSDDLTVAERLETLPFTV
jgi:hypothetical protein